MILLDPQLIAFEAIVKTGTVHAAARILHITQTAVTQRLKALESKMHTTLFLRTRRGMLLTNEGQFLHRYCQRVSELSAATLANIQGVSPDSKLRISIVGPMSIMRSRIVPLCNRVLGKFQNLYITFHVDDSDDLSRHLKTGDYDFAILPPEQISSEMASKLLEPEQYMLVCSAKWKKRKLADIIKNEKIIDFDQSDQMTFNYLKKFKLLKQAQTERHFVNNTESIAELFKSGFGYGVLTKEFAHPHLKAGDLITLNKNKIYQNQLALAWYARPEQPDYFSALLSTIE